MQLFLKWTNFFFFSILLLFKVGETATYKVSYVNLSMFSLKRYRNSQDDNVIRIFFLLYLTRCKMLKINHRLVNEFLCQLLTFIYTYLSKPERFSRS